MEYTGIKISKLPDSSLETIINSNGLIVVSIDGIGTYKLNINDLINLCKLPQLNAYTVLGNPSDASTSPSEWDVLLSIDENIDASNKLITEKAIRDYLTDKGYVLKNSPTIQEINSPILIKNTDNNVLTVSHITNDTELQFLKVGKFPEANNVNNPVGLHVDTPNGSISVCDLNKSGHEGPTLSINKPDYTYLRLNMNGLYYYGHYYNGYMYAVDPDSYIAGTIKMHMNPNSNYFVLGCDFPNVKGGFYSESDENNGYFHVNSNANDGYFQVNTTRQLVSCQNMPLYTNTGIYGGYKDNTLYGVRLYDDVNNESNRVSFMNGTTELGYFDQHVNRKSLVVGAYEDSANKKTELICDGRTYFRAIDTSNSYGTNLVTIGMLYYDNTFTNGATSVYQRWFNLIDSESSPTDIRTNLICGNSVSSGKEATYDLRSRSSNSVCYAELFLSSELSGDTVFLRAADSTYSSKFQLDWTKLYFDIHDSSSLLEFRSNINGSAFNVDFEHKQMTITGLDVISGINTKFVSPTLSGTPTTPTATLDTDTDQIASTKFVQSKLSAPRGSINIIDSTTALTHTDGAVYKLSGAGLSVTVTNDGSGVIYIQNDTTIGNTNTVIFDDITGGSMSVTLTTTATSYDTLTLYRMGSGYLKI